MDRGSDRGSASIFNVRVDHRNDVTLMALSGELDMATTLEFQEAVANLDGKGRAMLLDLRELTFIDSSGVQSITRLVNNLRDSWVRVDVVAASDPVKRVFELLGLDGILDGSAPVGLFHRFAKATDG
jgi:anti-sigma B factor antagonist